MTIRECIDKTDNVKPNKYSDEQKVEWLSVLDHKIFKDVILTHWRFPWEKPLKKFKPYSVDDMSTELIVEEPYEELYEAYLKMKIDEANEETGKYNNSATFFNYYLEEFKKGYNQSHKPINRARFNMWRP